MKQLLLFIILLFFTSCSTKTAPNKWQYDSTNAYNSYKTDFLQDNTTLADQDLNRAVNNAKMSADLTQLATIYLGKCALNKSVGIKDDCHEYSDIATLVSDEALKAYYNFISLSYTKNDVNLLPREYRNFALNVLNKNFEKAQTDIVAMQNTTSKLLATALIIDKTSNELKYEVLDSVSFHGYKKGALYLLKNILQNSNNKTEKENIAKKILILQGNRSL